MAAYIGHLSTASGDGPEVVIKIEGTDVVVVTPDGKIHIWPVELVRITGVSSPRFRITFDGDVAVFTAHHPSRFLFEFVPALDAARDRIVASGNQEQDGAAQSEDDRGLSDSSKAGTAPNEEQARATVSAESETPQTMLRGSHWAAPDGAAMSNLLKAAAMRRNNPKPTSASTEPSHESNGGPALEATTASLPRAKRWLRRESAHAHAWEPRTIAARPAKICSECSEVILLDEPTNTVIDLTDRAQADVSFESDSLRDRISGRFRRGRSTAGRPGTGD